MMHQQTNGVHSSSLFTVIEGGYYKRNFESRIEHRDESVDAHQHRSVGTAIYYLLKSSDFSALHRLKSDELWHLYYGAPIKIYVFHANSNDGNPKVTKLKLGNPFFVPDAR